jgi:hypothetical protein
MAVKPIVGYPNPFSKFAQTSLAPIGIGATRKLVVDYPDPLSKFLQSSLAPTGIGLNKKPFPPMPGTSGSSGGAVGYPI